MFYLNYLQADASNYNGIKVHPSLNLVTQVNSGIQGRTDMLNQGRKTNSFSESKKDELGMFHQTTVDLVVHGGATNLESDPISTNRVGKNFLFQLGTVTKDPGHRHCKS